MAKSPIVKKSAVLVGSVKDLHTLARKKARLQKHLKKHPKDLQSKSGFKGMSRKKPLGGVCPPKAWNLRDLAGHLIPAPLFRPAALSVTA